MEGDGFFEYKGNFMITNTKRSLRLEMIDHSLSTFARISCTWITPTACRLPEEFSLLIAGSCG